MKRFRLTFRTLGFLAFLMLCHGPAKLASAEMETKEESHVLVIHSYHPNFFWTRALKSGVDQTFEESHHNVITYHEFLDSKRFPEISYRQEFLDYLQNKYRDIPVDALMISDDPGLNFLLTVHDSHFPELPFVFMGVNNIQEKLLNIPWLTGVFENHEVAETIVEAVRQTGSDSIIVIGDSSETGQANLNKLKELEGLEGAPKNIILETDIVYSSVSEVLGPYPDHWPIFINGQLRDGSPDGPLLSVDKEIDALSKNLPNPIYVETSRRVEQGALGGKVLDGEYHAKQAVELVEKILDGQPVSEISPIIESRNQWMFNAEAG